MNVNRIDSTGAYSSGSVKSTTGKSDFSNILDGKMSQQNADLDSIFNAASTKYNVPLNLLKAVAKAESGFDPKATSSCGAMGIMQLMPGTAESLGVNDAYNPEQNIMGGAKYLSQLLSEFDGNPKLAVAAYNAGPGNVSKYGGIPPFKETQSYVEKVLDYCGLNISAGNVTYGGSVSSGVKASNVGSTHAKLSDAITGVSDSKKLSNELLLGIYQMQMQLFEDMNK